MRQCRPHHAWFAVMQWCHGVEQVGETTGAMPEGIDPILIRAVRMTDLDANAHLGQMFNQMSVTHTFRCQSQHTNGGDVIQMQNFCEHNVTSPRGLCTQSTWIDVGALKVNAQYFCLVFVDCLRQMLFDSGQHPFQLWQWCGHARR